MTGKLEKAAPLSGSRVTLGAPVIDAAATVAAVTRAPLAHETAASVDPAPTVEELQRELRRKNAELDSARAEANALRDELEQSETTLSSLRDELDARRQEAAIDVVRRVCRERKITVLFSAHELNQLLGTLDRVLYLGSTQAVLGTVDETVTAPILSRLYGTDIHVVRADGYIFVMSRGLDVEHTDHLHDHHSHSRGHDHH